MGIRLAITLTTLLLLSSPAASCGWAAAEGRSWQTAKPSARF